MTDPSTSPWNDARRLEQWAGELRVNLIRLIAIGVFYARHLVEWFTAPAASPVRGHYHIAVTGIALAWVMVVVFMQIALRRGYMPPWLKFAAGFADIFLTALLCMIAGGPQSPLVLLFFAIVATTPLRLSLPFVYSTTAGAMIGYLAVLGHYAWYRIGFHRYYATPELRIPRSHEAITLLALLVCGLLAGQAVRQMKRLVLRSVTAVERPEAA